LVQLEGIVSSLQTKLSDQTFAMHDLKSQLSEYVNQSYTNFSPRRH